MSAGAAFVFAGVEFLAGLDGALFWPAARTLIVADLHLEKGSSFADRGRLLPPYDSRATLARLATAIEARQPQRVLCLGDSFHDAGAPARLAAEERRALAALARGRTWIWITGNHDPHPQALPCGEIAAEVAAGPLVFRHQADSADPAAAEVSGHWHPKASVSIAGKRLRRRCFAVGSRRLIVPAYGAFTGGLDVSDPAIAGLFADGFTAYVLGYRRVHALPYYRTAAGGAGASRL